jgi:NMD protein affecting ribosome stability and mRNA decay
VRLAGVKPGDIVRADGMHALVVRKDRRALVVKGIGNGSTRRLRADEVDGHWRRVGWRRGTVPPAPRPDDDQVPDEATS